MTNMVHSNGETQLGGMNAWIMPPWVYIRQLA